MQGDGHDASEIAPSTARSFDDFRALARRSDLSSAERIGFPEGYREGFEAAIWADIRSKLTRFGGAPGTVLDIGSGCGDLALVIEDACRAMGHRLVQVDSEEMLARLPAATGPIRIAGRFPDVVGVIRNAVPFGVDIVLAYSLAHYLFNDGNLWAFCDSALGLLNPGGQFLLGDIPNISKRKRFFASAAGNAFHRAFTGRDEDPQVSFNRIELSSIDDSVMLGLVSRARSGGFDAYIMPQAPTLAMANRREDLLCSRP